jgi:hypothetical protein
METEILETASTGRDYIVDNRIRFVNGRLYVTRTPYENGQQVDFPEEVDVTEELLDTFLSILNEYSPHSRDFSRELGEYLF